MNEMASILSVEASCVPLSFLDDTEKICVEADEACLSHVTVG